MKHIKGKNELDDKCNELSVNFEQKLKDSEKKHEHSEEEHKNKLSAIVKEYQ
jgi:hypothetical protein